MTAVLIMVNTETGIVWNVSTNVRHDECQTIGHIIPVIRKTTGRRLTITDVTGRTDPIILTGVTIGTNEWLKETIP